MARHFRYTHIRLALSCISGFARALGVSLLFYRPTPIFSFMKKRNRTHHTRANHIHASSSDDAGGGYNRFFRTAKYQPYQRLSFGCDFLFHCRSPPLRFILNKFRLEENKLKKLLKTFRKAGSFTSKMVCERRCCRL